MIRRIDLILIKKMYGLCVGQLEEEDIKNYQEFIKRVTTDKDYRSARQNEFNKNNVEYHRLTNRINYWRKRGDEDMIRQIQEERNKLKGGAI